MQWSLCIDRSVCPRAQLHLGFNRLSGTIPDALAALGRSARVEWFDVQANEISGSLPTELRSADFLKIGSTRLSKDDTEWAEQHQAAVDLKPTREVWFSI